MDSPENILVLQLARFGDFLQTTPLLAALKRRYAGCRLTVLVNENLADLARGNPDVDQVRSAPLARMAETAGETMPLSEKLLALQAMLAPLKGEAYDLVLNLNTSRTAALISHLIPAGRRSGPHYGTDRERLLLAPWAVFVMDLLSHRRLGRFNLVDLLTAYAGPGLRPALGPVFPVSPDMTRQAEALLGPDRGRPLVGFQLGSNHALRQWPPSHFARLGAALIRRCQARIVLLGTGAEARLGDAFLDQLARVEPAGIRSVIPLLGRTSLPALAGVLKKLRLLVTTDTGTMHLAAAVKTPILALFLGPALCHETGPYGPGHVVLQAMTDCSPCVENAPGCTNPVCQEAMTPSLVEDAAAWLLSPGAPFPAHDDPGPAGVQALVSAVDRFGTIYEPLRPSPLTLEEVLALAFREAGRSFLEPGYALCPDELRHTLERFTPRPIRERVRQLLRTLSELEAAWAVRTVPPARLERARLIGAVNREPLLAPLGRILAWPDVSHAAGLKFVRDMVQSVALAQGYLLDRPVIGLETAPAGAVRTDMAPNLHPYERKNATL